MKKLLLLLGLTLGLIATDSPYLGFGVSASNAKEPSCRASPTLIGGVKFLDKDFSLSFEGRSTNSFNSSYTSNAVFIKPEYHGAYALLGYGNTNYTEHDIEFKGSRYGIGYDLGLEWRHLSVDILYDVDADDYVASLMFLYVFEGF